MTSQEVARCVRAAVAIICAGCGAAEQADRAGASGGTAAEKVDACELVPKSEVEAIVGSAVEEAKGSFSEHTYTKPTSYTAGCMYAGGQSVILGVNYPRLSSLANSEALASRITQQLRSQTEDDPSIAEIYRTTQVRPVEGLAGPAAAFEIAGQTTLEAHARQYTVKVTASSLDQARQVAAKAIERLP
jgi:hypothetical protein